MYESHAAEPAGVGVGVGVGVDVGSGTADPGWLESAWAAWEVKSGNTDPRCLQSDFLFMNTIKTRRPVTIMPMEAFDTPVALPAVSFVLQAPGSPPSFSGALKRPPGLFVEKVIVLLLDFPVNRLPLLDLRALSGTLVVVVSVIVAMRPVFITREKKTGRRHRHCGEMSTCAQVALPGRRLVVSV